MYGNHVFTFLYRTCRLSSIWVENGAHFGRFATKAWRISISMRRSTRGLLIRRPAKGGRAGGQPGPRFPGIRGFPRLRGFPSPRVLGGMPGCPFPIPSSICFPLYGIIPFPFSFIFPSGFSFLFPFLLQFVFYFLQCFRFYVLFDFNFYSPLCSPFHFLLYLVHYFILL